MIMRSLLSWTCLASLTRDVQSVLLPRNLSRRTWWAWLMPSAVPLGFFASDMIQWRRLLRRAARSGVIRLSLEHSDPRTAAGAFCVEKKSGRLRLICDRRVRNYREYLLGRARLPRPQRLSRMLLPGSHVVRTSGRDFNFFYFILKTDAARWPLQTWGPRVPAAWLRDLDNLDKDSDAPEADWWGPTWSPYGRAFLVCPPPRGLSNPRPAPW